LSRQFRDGTSRLAQQRCKRRTIRKRLKRQKKKGGKLPVDLVKLAKIAISPVLGNSLAELEVAFTNPVAHRGQVEFFGNGDEARQMAKFH
jgi:hypothetical protein